MFSYLRRIHQARYVWMNLAFSDLRQKYRRSKLGIAWALLQPLGMTLLLAYVIGGLFKQPMETYAPYIFSGLVVWDYAVNAAVGGCHALLNAQAYIKQFTYPYAIYTLRHTLAGLMNFLLAFLGLVLWVLLWRPEHVGLPWLVLPLAIVIMFLAAWGLATICAFVAASFHDFTQLVVIVLQAIWFISPIFFEAGTFRTNSLSYLVDYNPIYHVLELFRAPLLHGVWPVAENFLYAFGLVGMLWIIAALLIYRREKNLIYYL